MGIRPCLSRKLISQFISSPREEFPSDDEAEQLDDFARPLTSGELRTKVIKGITKRDFGATGGGVGMTGAGKQQTANYQPQKRETIKKSKK